MEISMSLQEAVDAAVADALGDAYDCLRVWSGWSHGSMSPDDFVLVAENLERVRHISSAVLKVLTEAKLLGDSPEFQKAKSVTAKSGWNSLSNLPKDDGQFLVATHQRLDGSRQMAISSFRKGTGLFDVSGVVAWRELPELSEQDQEASQKKERCPSCGVDFSESACPVPHAQCNMAR